MDNGVKKKILANDADKVFDYVIKNIVDPAIRQLVHTIITSASAMFLFDSPNMQSPYYGYNGMPNAWKQNNQWNTLTNGYSSPYNSMYNTGVQWGQQALLSSNTYQIAKPVNKNLNFDAIPVVSKQKAQDVLRAMQEYINRNGFVTVAEMADCADLTGYSTMCNYGWPDISGTVIKSGIDSYYISFPMPIIKRI